MNTINIFHKGLNAKVYSLKVEDKTKNKKVHKGKYC
jgi:hypothetical protein